MKFKLKLLGPNRTEVHVGRNIIFFSYETPVAAYWEESHDSAWIRTAERYSRTTSKHLGQWLGGLNVTVLPDDQFQTALAQIMSTQEHAA
jgi:hypothetical protein